MRQSRPTPCGQQDSTAAGGPSVTFLIEAETHVREAGRLLEVLAVSADRPAYVAIAGVLFGTASQLRNDRLGQSQ